MSRFEYARVVNFQRYKGNTFFHKYDGVLNMCRIRIPGSGLARFLHMQTLHKVLNMAEYAE